MQWMAFNIRFLHSIFGGTQWCGWLRHCATSRKVTGSIPAGVIGIFHWHNPYGHTMSLGLTQPLTGMVSGIFPGGQRLLVCRADNCTTFMCQLSWNLGASTSLNPQGLFRPVMGLVYMPYLKNSKCFPSPCRQAGSCARAHTHTHTHIYVMSTLLIACQISLN